MSNKKYELADFSELIGQLTSILCGIIRLLIAVLEFLRCLDLI